MLTVALPLLVPALALRPQVTFQRDVAPIVHAKCAVCHHPGDAAPFALIDYADVAKRAAQIVEVTQKGLMPPWLPARGENAFVGERSLSEAERETLRRWVADGKLEGDPHDAPPPPTFPAGWRLGTPDLVIELAPGYVLPAEGRDVYRNFVLPATNAEARWIAAVEFRPANRALVHHGVLFVDASGAARELDAADPEPGYGGMGPGRARLPGGTFVSYAPGKAPTPPRPGIAWALEPGTDLVLQLHMRPTGKAEPLGFALGLFFAAAPPTLHPAAIRLVSRDIDIPAGERAYVVEDAFELPVDVDVLSVLPHAHYLGKDLSGTALLPDGTRKSLIHVPSWDFDWQDEFRYREPLHLPRGSRLALRYTYDNSAENPANPSSPPRRVRHGPETTDEMAELVLEVLPREADRPLLLAAFQRKERLLDLAYVERMAREEPANPRWENLAGSYCLSAGRTADAVAHYRRLVELKPGQANPLLFLGRAELADGQAAEAERDLARALELEPDLVPARVELALAHAALGNGEGARTELEAALALEPANARIHATLGELDRARGETAGARAHFEAALAADPEQRRAVLGLADLWLEEGRTDEAVRLLTGALEAHGDDPRLQLALGLALEKRGARAEALEHLRIARDLDPADERIRASLERLEADAPDGAR